MEGVVEGYFLETADDLFFEVRGHTHPPGFTVAFLRYVPSKLFSGAQARRGFVKVYELDERLKLLERAYPGYLRFDEAYGRIMQEVPDSKVRRILDPVAKLMEIKDRGRARGLEFKALEMAERLAETSGIDLGSIGVTGSILLGLHGEGSDIDLIVYGKVNSLRVDRALRELLSNDRDFKPYRRRELLRLYRLRGLDGAISLEEFLSVEEGKAFQGLFRGIDYFIRFVKHPAETGEAYGDPAYKPLGRGSFEAVVLDGSEAIFTPCRYKVEGWAEVEGERIPLREVASFRGRFCCQAGEGKPVKGMGTVEMVLRKGRPPYYRAMVGESRGDFLIPRLVK